MQKQLSFDFTNNGSIANEINLLPVRPRPFHDEILSSWIWRLAAQNELTPYQLINLLVGKNLATREIDRIAPKKLLNALSNCSGIPITDVAAMTFADSHESLGNEVLDMGNTSHVVSIGYLGAEEGVRRGAPFCPDCFKEDSEPYYRKSWRLGFVVGCLKHKRLLTDKCDGCGHPYYYHRPATLKGKRFITSHISICQICGFNLTENLAEKNSVDLQLLSATTQENLLNVLNIGSSASFPQIVPFCQIRPWFAGVRSLLRFIVSKAMTNKFLLKMHHQYNLPLEILHYKEAFNVSTASTRSVKYNRAENQFEHYQTQYRAMSLVILGCFLENWPGVLHYFFIEDTNTQTYWKGLINDGAPFWLEESIQLAITNCLAKPTRMDKSQARELLKSKGYSRVSAYQLNAFLLSGQLPQFTDAEWIIEKIKIHKRIGNWTIDPRKKGNFD